MTFQQRHKADAILGQRFRHTHTAKLDDCGEHINMGGDLSHAGVNLDMSGPADEKRHSYPTFMHAAFATFHTAIVAVRVGAVIGSENDNSFVVQP